ncbi:hypothetical protein [Spirillospora sp. CA-128828]|uniref:hypothetical protein n=1 Tax=Spirillospora sp. CA-128828 TaxID=3240033 RepID=UPI003D8D4CF1
MLDAYADTLMAVAGNMVAGMFASKDRNRDPAVVDKVVVELAPAADWQWLVGRPSPITWSRSQANPVRKGGSVIVESLRTERPHHIDARHGWSLDVTTDGRSPGPNLAVTSINPGTMTVALL